MTMSVDRSPSLVISAFIFKKGDWEIRGGEVRGIPGTWYKVESTSWVIFCCPNCHEVSRLHPSIHKIDNLGKVTPDLQCKYGRCSFHRQSYLDEWNLKPLYACAVLENGKPRVIYMHASTRAEARLHLGFGNYEIVEIGRAVGFEVEDNHGEIVIARS